MNREFHGTMHGNTIVLKEPSDAVDGQEVVVLLKYLKPARPWGEGIRASAGAMADQWTEEDDRILEQIQQERRLETRQEIPPL